MIPDVLLNEAVSALARHGALGEQLVIAVSGGIDSVTLLHTINTARSIHNLSCLVAHANHGLRGVESDDDERLVVSIADSLGLPCITQRLDVESYARSSGLGIEGAARELRYQFLTRVAHESSASVVLTAHTMDDNAETMLMNLARASGTQGLSGIPPERALGPGVRVIRPFLSISRAQVRDAALSAGLEWREDQSNADQRFLRNRVRSVIMPALREVFGPSVSERILRSSELVRDADVVVRSVVREISPAVMITEHAEAPSFVVEAMKGLPRGLVHEIFRSALSCTHEDVARLTALLNAEAGSEASLSENRTALRERDQIVVSVLEHDNGAHEVAIDGDGTYVAGTYMLSVQRCPLGDLHPRADGSVAYIDVSSLQGPLIWREWRNGDRFQPFGLNGTVLVSDLLTNSRIPHAERRHIRVICDDAGIVWVCGIRVAERTRITSTTTDILILSVPL
ncbi:MAG: tRNA lysidine(34) synthetase TilS [Ignavibacteria bacterium]|nr:tRNA lysidine(34) synthetase TilS [Ignavibacteria bacterium]